MIRLLGLISLFSLMAVCVLSTAVSEAGAGAPAVQSAAEIDYPPFSIVDEGGRANGFSVELMRAALAAMGRDVTFRTGPWAEVMRWLQRGEIQALPLVGRTPEREFLFDFTFPYMTLHGAIVVREGTKDIQDLKDLQGREVAVMKDDNAEEFLRREERHIDIRTTNTFAKALQGLSEGRHDAVFIQRLVALRLIQEAGITNLQVIPRPVEGFRQDFCFAVKEGDPDTLALLNEGLALVFANGTHRRLHAKWFAHMELPTHRRIIVGGDHNYPPYEYLDEKGRPAGYNVELTRAIAQEVGLDIEIRLGPWEEVRSALARNEIDAIQGMLYSTGRDLTFDFSPPHTVNHYVCVVREGEGPEPATIEELSGKRIVVQRGDIMHDFVVENGLEDQVSVTDAQEDALRELAKGKHDCAVVARLTALFWINEYSWEDLCVGKRPFLSPGYCYAVPNNRQALLSQFIEGLEILEETGEYQRIQEKWMGVYERLGPDFSEIARYVAFIVGPLLVILLGSLLWSRSLRRQVAKRTEDLRKSEEFQRAMIGCSPVALYSIDFEGRVLSWNESAERIFGWKAEEVLDRPLPIVPADKKEEFLKLRELVLEGEAFAGKEVMRSKKDGILFDGSLSVAPIRNAAGDLIGIMAAMEDITQRKETESRLAWINRRNELLSATAARLLQSGDPQSLVEEVCHQVMNFLGCQAFFNYLEEPAIGKMRLNACAGIPEEASREIEWLEHGNAVCGCVARDRQRMIFEDILNSDDPVTELIKSYGIQCYVCHPLIVQDRLIGTLSFGSRSRPRFASAEIEVMGSVANFVAVAMDRLATEDALHRSEGLLNTAQRIGKIGGWEWDVYREEMFWTEETYRIHDLETDDELVDGKAFIDRSVECYAEEDRPRVLSAFNRCVEEGEPYAIECRFVSTKGRHLWIRTSGQAVWEEGRIVKVHGNIQDITEQKRAEQSLYDQNQFIRTILDNLPIGLAVNYIDEGSAAYVNNRFEEIYGWPKEELKDVEAFFEKVYPDEAYREKIRTQILQDTRSGDPKRMVWEGIEVAGQDGQKRTVAAKNIPLYEQGLMISTVQDISESRNLQNQLSQAQKMESVGRLAGGVAHDYNNMLSLIIGYTELAMGKVTPGEAIYEDLREISAAAKRSTDITRQLLAFARKQTITPRILDLNETVEGMLKMLRRLIGEDIDLAWLPDGDLGVVKMDPSQVDQIMANLCVNARDAINGVGRVTIETKNVSFDQAYCADHGGFVPGDFVMLAVSDDGCGMDKETLDKVFDPFFTTKDVGEGTGLGLSTVYGIVKQNEGFLKVYSELEKGTTFRVYLPRQGDYTGPVDSIEDEESPRGEGETVLLVEDEVPILKLGRTMLSDLNYRVLEARTPGEAMALAENSEDEIELLITDVVMPDMNGRDLAEEMRLFFPGLRVLFMSGYTANVIAHHGVLEEGICFMQKPFSKKDLAKKVREALNER